MAEVEKFEGKPVLGHRVDMYARRGVLEGRFHQDEDVVLLVRGRVDDVHFPPRQGGVDRVHKLAPDMIVHLTGKEGDDALARLKAIEQEQRLASGEDERTTPMVDGAGRPVIPDEPTAESNDDPDGGEPVEVPPPPAVADLDDARTKKKTTARKSTGRKKTTARKPQKSEDDG